MTRYVAIHEAFIEGDGVQQAVSSDIEELKKWGPCYRIYELGPEVKEPDYGPLVEWMRMQSPEEFHEGACNAVVETFECACGLTSALKAAGL